MAVVGSAPGKARWLLVELGAGAIPLVKDEGSHGGPRLRRGAWVALKMSCVLTGSSYVC